MEGLPPPREVPKSSSAETRLVLSPAAILSRVHDVVQARLANRAGSSVDGSKLEDVAMRDLTEAQRAEVLHGVVDVLDLYDTALKQAWQEVDRALADDVTLGDLRRQYATARQSMHTCGSREQRRTAHRIMGDVQIAITQREAALRVQILQRVVPGFGR